VYGRSELWGRRKKCWLASSADESCLTLPVTIETVRRSHQRERKRARQGEHQQAKAADRSEEGEERESSSLRQGKIKGEEERKKNRGCSRDGGSKRMQ